MIIINLKGLLGGIKGMSIFPFILTQSPNDKKHINHEKIHIRQQLEMGVLLFYPVYFYFNIVRGYRSNPFEVEAYDNDDNLDYLKTRKFWAWTKSI